MGKPAWLWLVFAGIVAALLAGIVPAWRIARIAPALALREE